MGTYMCLLSVVTTRPVGAMNRPVAVSTAFWVGTRACACVWIVGASSLCTTEVENAIPPLLLPIGLRWRTGTSTWVASSVAWTLGVDPSCAPDDGGEFTTGIRGVSASTESSLSSSFLMRAILRRLEGRKSGPVTGFACSCSDMSAKVL